MGPAIHPRWKEGRLDAKGVETEAMHGPVLTL